MNNMCKKSTDNVLPAQRNSSFELLRIISMFLIVMSHYTTQGIQPLKSGIMDLVYSLFPIGGTVGVDCFVLITGYFMINSSVTFTKIARLLYQVFIVAASISLAAYFIGSPWFETGSKQLMKSAIGIFCNYWFINTYLLLMLLSPFLNKILRKMTQKQHLICMCALVFLNYMAPHCHIPIISNVGLFITLYAISAYIRMYVPSNWISVRKVGIFIIALLIIEVVLIWLTHQNRVFSALFAGSILGHDSLYLLIFSTLVFVLFTRLFINNSRAINYMGSCTLGIYLFHEHVSMRHFLWQTILNCEQVPYGNTPYLHSLIAIPFVFGISLVVAMLYRHTFGYLYAPLYRYILNPVYCAIKSKLTHYPKTSSN